MKYTEKTQQYIALNSKTDLTKAEKQKLHNLRSQLTARGLDPAHESELMQRAIIFDHEAKCRNFIALHSDDKSLPTKAAKLEELGIKPDQKYLARILADIAKNAKSIDKKKSSRRHCANAAREYADRKLAEFEVEIANEDEGPKPGLVDEDPA